MYEYNIRLFRQQTQTHYSKMDVDVASGRLYIMSIEFFLKPFFFLLLHVDNLMSQS